MSDLPLNLAYLRTPQGKVKSLAVFVGVFALAFTVVAFDQSDYYRCRQGGQKIRSVDGKCPLYTNHDACLRSQEIYKSLKAAHKKNGNKKLTQDQKDEKFGILRTCPHSALVILPVVILSIVWPLSFLLLFAMLVVDLYQRSRGFRALDLIFHSVGAGLLLLSALLLGGFIVWVLYGDWPCTRIEYDKLKKGKGGQRSRNAPQFPSRGFGFGEDCLGDKDYVFELWLILVGTFWTLITGLLFGVATIIMVKRGRTVGLFRAPLRVTISEPGQKHSTTTPEKEPYLSTSSTVLAENPEEPAEDTAPAAETTHKHHHKSHKGHHKSDKQ